MTTIVGDFLTKYTMVSYVIINCLSGGQLNGLTLLSSIFVGSHNDTGCTVRYLEVGPAGPKSTDSTSLNDSIRGS